MLLTVIARFVIRYHSSAEILQIADVRHARATWYERLTRNVVDRANSAASARGIQ